VLARDGGSCEAARVASPREAAKPSLQNLDSPSLSVARQTPRQLQVCDVTAMRSASFRRSVVLALASGLWLFSAPAYAVGIEFQSQERYVEATTSAHDSLYDCGIPGFPPCDDSASAQISAPDSGPFDATVAPTCSFLYCPDVSASQNSTITASEIDASGQILGNAYYGHEGTQYGYSSGQSYLSISFRIDQPTPYEISSFLTGQDQSNDGYYYEFWTLDLAGVAGDLLYVDCSAAGSTTAFECDQVNVLNGILEPGDYTLRLSSNSNAALGESANYYPVFEAAAFDVSLRLIPEPSTGLLLLQGLLAFALASRRRVHTA
jgi:hypothetical protein